MAKHTPPTKKHPVPRLRASLRLPAADHRWWADQVARVARAEHLLEFSLTALMHRIAEADLDLTHSAILQYQSINDKNAAA